MRIITEDPPEPVPAAGSGSQAEGTLLAPKTSTAEWIWCGDDIAERNVWVWARKAFQLTNASRGSLSISADLRYMAWLNGKRIGFGPPKFHASTPTVDRYDVSELLRDGGNVLAVCVYSLGAEAISSCSPQRGALWVDLEIDDMQIATDRTWKMHRDLGYSQTDVAFRSCQPPNECYDARQGLGLAYDPDLDDSRWSDARILKTAPLLQSESRDIPFMAAEEYLPDRLIECGLADFTTDLNLVSMQQLASALWSATHRVDRMGCFTFLPFDLSKASVKVVASTLGKREAAYLLWDFGRIWSGYPVLRVSGTPGTVIELSYGEHLQSGRVNPTKSRLHYADRIILGKAPLEHRITWPKCARYVQLYVHGGDAEIERISWERSTYPTLRRGSFTSSRPVMDQAVEISLHTTQLCMEDSYMDTPWRERGSWLGDDLVKAQIAHSYFQDYALTRRFLLHHSRGQRENGMLQGKYPGNITSDVSTWTLRFAPSVLEYCAESGDWKFAREIWPVLQNIIHWLNSLKTPNGLFQAPPVHVDEHVNRYNFIDWAPIDMRGINSAWNAFAHGSLLALRDIARQIELPLLTRELDELIETHRAAFRASFWDATREIFVNGIVDGQLTERWGCHENYLAILFDLANEHQSASIIKRLKQEDIFSQFIVEDLDYDEELPGLGKIPTVSLALSRYRWPAQQMVPIGTAYFSGYMLAALCKLGMIREAAEYIERHWGNFSAQGATTVWETWDMSQSLSHGWASGPAIFAARTILGVERDDHTGTRYHILPYTLGSAELRGRVTTKSGPVQVDWTEGILRLDLPEHLEFSAGLPMREGKPLFVDGVAATTPTLVHKNGISYLSVSLSSGSHRLEMK